MKQQLSRLALVLVSVFSLSLLSVSPVFAQNGADDSSSSSTTSTQTSTTENETEHVSSTEIKSRINTFNTRAKDEVKSLQAKQDATEKHSEQERQKSCESRSTELTKKLNKKVADAQKHQAVFDKIYARVKAFHDSKNLNTPNYTELVAKVDAAQANAAASITTLKGLDTTIDCTQVDAAATKVAAFRDALKATRDALHAYQLSIKDLIVAVKGSIPADTTSTSTTTTTTTNTTSGN